ncbi:MAG TPA: hypothetical protein VI911_09885 [Patescibacteria group bacterium]|nr:hypothetical protein [Patescibacteria group bacterium]
MSFYKNNLIDVGLNQVIYTVTEQPYSFNICSLNNVVTPSISGNLNSTRIRVPFDMIVFGRVRLLTLSTNSLNWEYFWSNTTTYAQTNCMVGVNQNYFNKVGTTNTATYGWPVPIYGGVSEPKFYYSINPTSRTSIPINTGGKPWAYLENFIAMPVANGTRSYSTTIISITDSYQELQRELQYDSSNEIIHYITLAKYSFKYKGLIQTQLYQSPLEYMRGPYNITLLLDFKYHISNPTKLVGLDILNKYILNIGESTGINPSVSLVPGGTWSIGVDFGSFPTTSFGVGQPSVFKYTLTRTSDTFLWNDHKIYYPTTVDQSEINKFSSFQSTPTESGVCVLYEQGRFRTSEYFHYDQNGVPELVDWRLSIIEKSHWVPEKRAPASRELSRYRTLPYVWSLNPSGVINTTDGRAFPILSPVRQTYNSQYCSSAIFSLPDETSKYTIELLPLYGFNVVASNFPGGIGSMVALNDKSIKAQERELQIAGVTYTTAGDDFYILYILTRENLYMHVIYGNNNSAIYTYPGRNNIIGVYSNSPLSENLTCEYLTTVQKTLFFTLETKIYRINMSSMIPTASLNTEITDTAVNYDILLTFSNKEQANEAKKRIDLNQWEVRTTTGQLITIDKKESRVGKRDGTDLEKVYIRINLIQYLRDSGALVVENLKLYVRAIDFHVPYIIVCTITVDGRILQLGSLTFNYKGITCNVPLSASFANGVIHTTLNDLNTSTFTVSAPGDVANVLSTKLTWAADNQNWMTVGECTSREGTGSSGFFNNAYPAKYLIWNKKNPTETQFLIHGNTSTPVRSNTVSGNVGTNSGLKLVVTSKCYEKKEYMLPQITVYDDHKFIIGKIYNDNLVDIDRVPNGFSTNYSVKNNNMFVPKLSDNNNYAYTFNFRCSPNYLDITGRYTIYYENDTSDPISGRISTPMIKRWWIIGIPVKQDNPYLPYVNYIRGITADGGAITLTSGTLNEVLTEGVYPPTRITEYNFDYKHRPNYAYRSVSRAYLHNEYTDRLVLHVTNATGNTNCGTVWTSGTCTVPSGYMDFKDVQFSDSNLGIASLTSGMIPNGLYGIFFIVEDTIGHRTGIDLLQLSTSTQLPASGGFNY